LRNRRAVDVYLPPSYGGSRRRYPVIYLQDGQNLSNPETAFSGTWELPRAMRALAAEGLEAIIVGIHHGVDRRLPEYSPYSDSKHGAGDGRRYLGFLTGTLKPRIDRRFRTLPDRDATAIGGSSMGGLISLYAFLRFGAVFGAACVMSPALWFGDRRIFEAAATARARAGRIYLDVGTAEGPEALKDARRMRRLLQTRGYRKGSLLYHEAEGAPHSEAAWAERLAPALAFVLGRGGNQEDLTTKVPKGTKANFIRAL
jgi:predicted alpha/beta superfamily hydrolase